MTSTTGRVLVVDVGTSSVRAAVIAADGTSSDGVERELLPDSPADGLVEFDAALMARTCLELARAALDAGDGAALEDMFDRARLARRRWLLKEEA